MASEWWWFLVLNAIIAAVAVLSKVRPTLPSSPRGGAGGFTRRASSAVLHRLRSSIFSFPSAAFHTTQLPHPEAVDATVSQETEQPAAAASPTKRTVPTPRAPALTPRSPAPPAKEEEENKMTDDDPNAMSMEEAYALVQAARRQPESERAAEARRSDVDAKAEEFIQGFKEDLRQQRLNSIFNYTQMLKKRAFGGGSH
ncbi:hypothetical protein EJB05_42801, partial [Eragrostis curvula]